jgi:hypothetical protein
MPRVKPDTAKAYVKSLRATHVECSFPTSVVDDPRIDLVVRGKKRCYGEGEKRLRLPLTAPILCRIIREIRNDYDGVNLKAAICVAFAAFLRSGEFTWDNWTSTSSTFFIARKHIKFNTTSVTVTLPASKADPFRKGIAIQLASSPTSQLCPVRALRQLYTLFPRDPSHPLFSRSLGPFSRKYLVDKIKELLLRAGISTLGFSGHSLRKGAAVSAAANGLSKDDIKLLGRWKSDAVDTYINEISLSERTQKLLQLNSQVKHWQWRNDLLLHKSQIYIPHTLCLDVLRMHHNDPLASRGSLRHRQNAAPVAQLLVSLHRILRRKVCVDLRYLLAKKTLLTSHTRRTNASTRNLWPMEGITCDFVTDLPISNGHDSLLVFVDRFTNVCHIIPCKAATR